MVQRRALSLAHPVGGPSAIATLQMQVGSAPAQSATADMDVDQQETKVKVEEDEEESGEGLAADVASTLDATAKG